MKQRGFVLIELMIALSLLAACTFPFSFGLRLYIKKQKELLIDLEKERKAEELFFSICQKLCKNHLFSKLSQVWRYDPKELQPTEVTFDLGALGKETFYWHYHLITSGKRHKSFNKLLCQICFQKKRNLAECDEVSRAFLDAKYGFALTVELNDAKKT